MPHVKVRDVSFYFQQAGNGPDVVMLHGMTGNLAVWMLGGLLQRLSANFRITVFDARGHGYSDTPASNYTSADMADDVAAICDALKLNEVLLVGHSFGGAVALHTAERHPALVAGLVLSDPFIPALRHLQANPRQWQGFDDYRSNAATAGVQIDGNLWDLEEMIEQVATLSDQSRQMFIERVGASDLNRIVRLHGTSCGSDVAKIAGLTTERIAMVAQPFACLCGDSSPFLPMCTKLVEITKSSSLELIDDAQHFAFEENPSEFADAVEKHLCTFASLQPQAPPTPSPARRPNIMTTTQQTA